MVTGYLYKQTWNINKQEWSEEELITPFPVSDYDVNDIVKKIHPKFGEYEISNKEKGDTIFTLRDECGYLVDFNYYNEILPWD